MFETIMNNMFIRLVIAAAFFWFVYKILFEIGVFFGLDQNVLGMYYVWIGIIVVLLTILPQSKSRLAETFDLIVKTGQNELIPKERIIQISRNATNVPNAVIPTNSAKAVIPTTAPNAAKPELNNPEKPEKA
jgi:hypothetical protein